jgi:hypothetical protein
MQYHLAKESFAECDVEIVQAAYDGASLYVVYSIRERNAAELLGFPDDEPGIYYVGEETFPAMERDGLGWWTDHLWIDGADVRVPDLSSGMVRGSETPGEMLFYRMFRLDLAGVRLDGKAVEIALPIGQKQPYEALDYDEETGVMQKPAAGTVAFMLDCSVRSGVTETHPRVRASLILVAAEVTEVLYSPIQLYVTVSMRAQPGSLDAYVAENGEGIYDQDGSLLRAYAEFDVCGAWLSRLQLVDGEGKPVFETTTGFYGLLGYNETVAWFAFPYRETYPAEMYLAPTDGGATDMAQAVRVK